MKGVAVSHLGEPPTGFAATVNSEGYSDPPPSGSGSTLSNPPPAPQCPQSGTKPLLSPGWPREQILEHRISGEEALLWVMAEAPDSRNLKITDYFKHFAKWFLWDVNMEN